MRIEYVQGYWSYVHVVTLMSKVKIRFTAARQSASAAIHEMRCELGQSLPVCDESREAKVILHSSSVAANCQLLLTV